MRTVEVSRFVSATGAELDRALSPRAVLEYEGTFTVTDVSETADGWTATASAPGMTAVFDFEPRDRGLYYAQEDEHGPFEAMETTIAYEREREGSVVTARSSVSLGLPLGAVSDRIAAWKRRGELKRTLRNLAADVE